MDNPKYSKQFVETLSYQGYPIDDMVELGRKEVAAWTRLPIPNVNAGAFNPDRDLSGPLVQSTLENVLQPWIAAGTDFPSVQVAQVSRATGLSPEIIMRTLTEFPLEIGGKNVVLSITKDDLKGTLNLRDCRRLGISPKRIIGESRYESRDQGGGPVQKAAIDNSKISPKIKLEARKRARINFILPQTNDVGVMSELEMEASQNSSPLEEVLADEPFRAEILQIMDLLKAQGFGNKWILGQQESLLAENLVKLSRGEPCDFLIWNCIGFTDWEQGNKGKMPACNITSNEEAAITRYFQDEIIKLSQILSTIGDPQFTILLPTNEAFDPNVWNYKQPINEREQVMDDAVVALQRLYSQVAIPKNAKISVKRWDTYLDEKNASRKPTEYSELGYKMLMDSPDREKIEREAIRSGMAYYSRKGIRVTEKVLAEMQLRYYGVYAGEGVVFDELQRRGDGIIVLNFEEFRCAQNAFRGAGGNLAVVTAITDTQMKSYYQWEERI